MKKIFSNIKNIIKYSGKSLAFLWRKNPAYVILIFINIIVGSIQVFPGMYLIKYSIDILTRKGDMTEYIIAISVIIAVMILFNIVSGLINNRIGYYRNILQSQIGYEISDVCMNVEYKLIGEKGFLEEKEFTLETLNQGKLESVINSIAGIISGIIVLSGTIYITSSVSVIIIVPLIISVICLIYYDYKNATQQYFDTKLRTETIRKVNYIYDTAQNFSYAKEIRLFNLKDKLYNRMKELQEILFKTRVKKATKIIGFAMLIIYLSDTILEAGIYLYLGYEVLMLHSITVGEFTLIGNALREIRYRISGLVYNLVDFTVNTQYLEAFFDFFRHKEEYLSEDANKADLSITGNHEIVFENVSFKYPNSDVYALNNVNITIRLGQALLIVGENGAGKTTFIKLLIGLYKPISGRILIDGIDINEFTGSSYNKLFSAVFQDYKLFAMTIKENITAMEAKYNEPLIRKSLSMAKLDIDENTPLYRIFDEKGIELSGGETQRFAIARAVYKDAPIIVLDEPTAALDPRAEFEIYDSFNKISENKTSVYISHRLSSSKFCDCIAVFDKGEITEYGSHNELIAKDGLYKELYTMQADLYRRTSEAVI